jgi:hypothetical protein
MPALTYPTSDFVPFTKILSSEVNGKFNAITTLLNTTGLNSTNIQVAGLNYNLMTITTSLQIVGTSSAGVMTTQALVLASQGGTGFAFASTTLNANLVVQANSAGSALTLSAAVQVPTEKVYMVLNYT